MSRSIYDVQRDFALSSGLRSEIIWDSLAPDQSDVLKQKIASLIGDSADKESNSLAKQRQDLFDNVWRQRIYTNGTLLSAIIYVLVTPERDPQLALQSTSYSCHPVIRTRKCISANGENSEGCCMVFVDEHGRVYGNWSKYVNNNALPKGTMIAPAQGIYTFDTADKPDVQLMVQATPALYVKQKLLSIGDNVATIGGVVACVPLAATLALPVAGSLLMGATVVGISTAAYNTVRSAARLIDRRWHAQTTSLRNRDARSSWLGMAGGVVSLGACGATKALTCMQRKAPVGAQLGVKGINVSSIVLSGTGVANNVYGIFSKLKDDESLSSHDMLQITSSLLTFTHSINNLRIASKVSNGQSLRRALRHQTRKTFDRISQEAAKLHSNASSVGKFDIVRTLNDIPIKETLLSLHKIHTHLAQGVSVVGALSAIDVLPNFVNLSKTGELSLDLQQVTSQFGSKFVQQIGNLGSFADVLECVSKSFSEKAVQLLLQLTRNFVESSVDSIDRTLNTFVSTELVLYRILMHCINNYKNCAAEFLEQQSQEILDITSKYFQSLNPDPTRLHSRKQNCTQCGGVYYTNTL